MLGGLEGWLPDFEELSEEDAGESSLRSGSPDDDVSGPLYPLGLYLADVLVVGDI